MFEFLRHDKYYSKGSCKFLLQYHLIFVCKYRKKLLQDNLNTDMLQILLDISKNYEFEIKTLQSDVDHVHMLISTTPQICISQIVRVLKQESTFRIWQKYDKFLKRHFWKEHTFWSDGYFVTTCGDCSTETIQHYIDTQGKN